MFQPQRRQRCLPQFTFTVPHGRAGRAPSALCCPQLCLSHYWTPGAILMGDFYRCDSWSKVLSTCENQVFCLQRQPGHSKIITHILKNNEIGLENKMVLDIMYFICIVMFMPFVTVYSSLPFIFPSQQELETFF